MIFNIEAEKSRLERAERIRVWLWPWAIKTMEPIRNQGTIKKVVTVGSDDDWRIMLGGLRISHVAGNASRTTDHSTRRRVRQVAIAPAIDIFSDQNLTSKIVSLNADIHGRPTDWLRAHRQDKLATDLSEGSSKAAEIALASIEPSYLEDLPFAQEQAAKASEIGILLVRIARAARDLRLMEHGVKLVEQAHEFNPNPDRVQAIYTMAYSGAREIGSPAMAKTMSERYRDRFPNLPKTQSPEVQFLVKNLVGYMYFCLFKVYPIENIIG